MDIWGIVAFGLTLLLIVVGGYMFMFFHIIRKDPREIDMRKQNNETNTLLPKKKDINK